MWIDDDLGVTVWISTRDPDVTVAVDANERHVAVTLGNDVHGEVLNMTFSDPAALRTLGSQLLAAGRKLAELSE
jgi:hypothetical protein